MRHWSFADAAVALFSALLARLDRRLFMPARADYYEFLSAVIKGAKGRHTLRDIFDRDARRYAGTVRGRLSSAWSRGFPAAGGDLYATWLGCFPASELAIIRVAQLSGNETLVHTLADLAHALRLSKRSRHIVWVTVWSGVLSLCVLAATIMAVPQFTVPRLAQLFGALPFDYFGYWTQALFAFAALVRAAWAPVLAALLAGVAMLCWSIPNLTGALRNLLDQVSIWKIHRCLGALRFMSVLTVVLQRQGASSTQLRTAVALLCAGASPWMRGHLEGMLDRIDHGLVGAETFDTGLLDRDLYWYLQDMAEARGLVGALVLLRDRLDGRVLPQVARQAQVLRWALLVCCVAGMLALGLWHYVVIDELRRSLMIFHASQ
ncbi:hypothetical protein [Pusillimonas noertemannii]|uniref:hypothetical protein n=1 Tax=Pusillimonas noertemannii TaxID=305977 RepID=UPI0002F8F157|nr:hypothetical protein [Pusillimonas noertemannii]